MNKHLVWISFIFLFSFVTLGQTSDELKKEQQGIEKQIRQIKTLLDKTSKSQDASIGELQLIKRKISLRAKLIKSINREIVGIQRKINVSNAAIKESEKKIIALKKRYEKNIKSQYKHQTSQSWWIYFFNSGSLSSSIRMFNYLSNYRKSLLLQSEEIKQLKKKLAMQVQALDKEKQAKKKIANRREEELNALNQEKASAQKIVNNLASKKRSLQKEIKKQKKKQAQLKKQIADVIKKELEEERKRRAKAKRNKNAKKPSSLPKRTYTEEDIKNWSANFIEQKGKMPWPVKGVILTSYGKDIFEGSSISGKNIGTTFRADVGDNVVAIADGVVSSSLLYQGVYTIIIKHGNYFSGYSNLQSIAIKKGDIVAANTVIGTVAQSDSGNWGELALQLVNLKGNVNPESFLHK